jgi:pilus assembly protein CpaE
MPAGEKVRVLIVDDVAETRENVRRLLQFEADIEVVGAARTAQEGIQLTGELDPDVVLMDINMPDMDGIAPPSVRQRSPQAGSHSIGAGRSELHAAGHAGRRPRLSDETSHGGRSHIGRSAQRRIVPRRTREREARRDRGLQCFPASYGS